MGRTTKPCPGCQKVVPSREADGVCHECERILKSHYERVNRINADPDLVTARVSTTSHWYPCFYYSGPRARIEGFSETRDELAKLFCELAQLCVVEKMDWLDCRHEGKDEYPFVYTKPNVFHPAKPGESYGKPVQYPSSDGGSHEAYFGKFPKCLLAVIQTLWDRTARFAEMSYLGGLQDGRNFLLQLSSGDLSVSDVSEQDASIAKHIQDSAYLHKKRGSLDADRASKAGIKARKVPIR
jgi:hypothetical protein